MTGMERLPFGSTRPLGWIKAQIENDLVHGFAGCLDQLTRHASNDLWIDRIGTNADQVAWWDAETRGNWVWGLSMAAITADHQPTQQKAKAIIERWIESQDPDGYLGIYNESSRYLHPPGEQGELWAQSRTLLAMLTWYEFRREPVLLQTIERAVARTRAAHAQGAVFFAAKPNSSDGCGTAHGLCYMDLLRRLAEVTANPEYRTFASELYEEFSRAFQNTVYQDVCADALSTRRKFRGHAVHTVEHIRCLITAIEAGVTPPNRLRSALRKLAPFRLPSGAIQGDESLRGPSSPAIGYEYCTMTEMAMTLGEVGRFYARPEWFDWLETLLYSAAQGARQQDGSGIGYLTSDDQFSADSLRPDAYSGSEPGGRFKISPTHEDVACCCNPNSVRLMPQFVADLWSRTADGFACCAFGPSELTTHYKDSVIKARQVTDYPREDQIRFEVHVEGSEIPNLYVRHPQWPGGLNVRGSQFKDLGEWIRIEINRGDNEFTVCLQPEIHLEAYGTREMAVKRGPVQYVQPLPHQIHVTKSYPGSDLADRNFHPLGEIPSAPTCRMWTFENDSIVLGDGIRLVPIGATTLRRAGFNIC